MLTVVDAKTMRSLTQTRFQCDADLAGNLNKLHFTCAHIGYIGNRSVGSSKSRTQGSLSTLTFESEIKAVNQCLSSCYERYFNSNGFPIKCN